MNLIQEITFKKVLTEHQFDYRMLTKKPKPVIYCTCGKEIVVDLPENIHEWLSATTEAAVLSAQIKHQMDTFFKELEKINKKT